ncbi:hypothetical protein AA0242T_1385 [Acetobacter aceti NRIC 0242]|uniref:Uncharacterized protein n=1 Tax=Acetobacter aceti NBRC 14818 TaxID=887700 RepID=A0AB33IGE3_ACEAC|nr:hypothetical protein [Acetobacter aceti]TCS31795.1 hypothetical protein EDC15_11527 [Acetobacter aceti NBRC 14818]BCK77215.1 hypothetical protein EMQ_2821 [Acetobacter aceti NBRC 14818]GAN58307.1 hypothetical protein Abac_041_053 [Acetobacter aceti NBRC 14818]GBO80683.1 hypothetical protein AA0242T_1385 [Acetobacter aceti NRIC 0242]
MTLSEEEDAYANRYLLFIYCLDILAQDVIEQCRILQYYNVAWELKNDTLSDGYDTLSMGEKYLTLYQKCCIKMLLQNIENIPDEIINVTNIRKNHLKTMSDPVWTPLRIEARKLLDILAMETQRVRRLLNMDP